MLLRQRRDPFVDLRPDFRRHHGFERRRRDFQGEVAAADVPGVDDLAIRRPCADEKARHGLDRLLRGRQADPLQLAAAQILQSLQRQRQMRAALVRRQRVDLVDDHRPRRRQHLPAGFGTEQNVERFRRRHDDMRRPPTRAVAFGLRSVAGSHPGADIDVRQPLEPAAPRGCRPAAPPDFSGCRWTAPSAARRRRPAFHPAARPRARAAPVRRSPRGTRTASCRTRSAPRSAYRARL